jgi:hypothetical protein
VTAADRIADLHRIVRHRGWRRDLGPETAAGPPELKGAIGRSLARSRSSDSATEVPAAATAAARDGTARALAGRPACDAM